MSAALASNKSEPSTSGIPNAVSTGEESSSSKVVISDQGSSSSTAVESPLIDTNVQSPDAIDAASHAVMKNKGRDCKIEVHIITCTHCFISHLVFANFIN